MNVGYFVHQHRNKVIINSVTLRYGTSTKLFILWNKLVVKFILFTVCCAVAVVHISIRLNYIGHCKWPKCAVLIIICNLWHHSLTHSLVRIHINWHLFAAVKQVARFCCPFKLFNRNRNAQYSHPSIKCYSNGEIQNWCPTVMKRKQANIPHQMP